MKYHIKDYSTEESYERDLQALRNKINANNSFSDKSLELPCYEE